MKTKTLFGLLPILLLASCEREDSQVVQSTKTKPPSVSAKTPIPRSAIEEVRDLASRPAASQPATLARHIYGVADEDLDLVMETIIAHEEPALKQTLLTVVYEESHLRPTITRLPLLLELARQPETEPSLQASIMAELGTTLGAEHGTSWADWALALEEHLAETEGLIRVE